MRYSGGSKPAVLRFIDNLSHSVSIIGDILCYMVPRIYKGDRLQNIILPGSEEEGQIHLGFPIKDEETQRVFNVGAMMVTRYYCTTSAGPMFETERERLMNLLMEMAKANPQIWSIAGDILFELINVSGSQRVAARIKRTMPPHLLSEQERAGLPQQQQPTPEQQAEQIKHQATIAKAQSVAQVAQINHQIKEMELRIKELEAESGGDGRGDGESNANIEAMIDEKIRKYMGAKKK